jgi:hypothetical protein
VCRTIGLLFKAGRDPGRGAPSFFVRDQKCLLMLLDDHQQRA